MDEDDERISYINLNRHILATHPYQADETEFGLCTDIGSLPLCNCCFPKKMVKNKTRGTFVEVI